MTPSNLSSILARLTSTCGFGVVSAAQMQNDAGLTVLEIEALLTQPIGAPARLVTPAPSQPRSRAVMTRPRPTDTGHPRRTYFLCAAP